MEDHITTIGMDLGDQYSDYCVLDGAGKVEEEGRIRTTARTISKTFSNYERVQIVMEVGTHSAWVSRLLMSMGHKVMVANARKVSLIYKSEKKRDRVDAKTLARLGRIDPELLYPIEHRGEQAQTDLAVIRARDTVVRARTNLINHTRGLVKSFGMRLGRCSAEGFSYKVVEQVPGELRSTLMPVLGLIGEMTGQIRGYDTQIEVIAQRYPETAILKQVSGVGTLTALAYVLTIEDPYRFKRSRSVGAFFGLVPRLDQSGQSNRQLPITHAGDGYLRRLLVGSGQFILGPFGPDCDLRRWGLALAARGGKNAKKRAVVAVARKLAVLLHRLWITGEVYEPFRAKTEESKVSATAA